MTIFAPSISSLYHQIRGYGLDPDPLFRSQGLDPQVIFDPSARVDTGKSDQIALMASKQVRDPYFGLKIAHHFRPAHLGALGFAWLASPTLRKALERLQKYARKADEQLEVTFVEADGRFFVQTRYQSPSPMQRERDDCCLAILVKMCRIVYDGELNPLEVHSTHPPPDDPGGYYAYFRSPMRFGKSRNGVLLLSEWIDRRLTGANEELAQMNDHIVVKYLGHRNRNDIVNRVRTSILEGIADGNATARAAAADLHMTTRNMNRRLQDHQTSFKQLLSEIRQELAEKYLEDQSLSLTEIAFLLGFSEVSSFSRAYKRWTGHSPSGKRDKASVTGSA